MTTPHLRAARVLSIAGHPFLVVPLAFTAIACHDLPLGRALRIVAIAFSLTIVPLTVVIVRNVRRAAWADFDVSVVEQRRQLYPLSILLALLALGALVLAGAPPGAVRTAAAAGALAIVSAVVNRWTKISLHAAYDAFAAACLASVWPVAAVAGIALLAAVCWSRVVLGRHTALQVTLGAVAGAIAGASTLLWP